MENIVTTLIEKVAILFVLMIPGILLKKLKMVPDGFGKGLSNLVLYIAQPVLVFLAYIKPYSAEILINSLYVFALSVVAHALFAVVAMLLFRDAEDGKRRMLRFATIFSNAAFMGIPLIDAVLESSFPGATLYASIYNITFNLFLWTLGVRICTQNRDVDNDGIDDHKEAKAEGASVMKALLHPVTLAAALGLVFFVFSLTDYIPEAIWSPVYETASHLKNLVAPLSMAVIGLRLPDISFRGAHKDKHSYIFLALRHIILPLIVIGFIKLVGIVLPIPEVVATVVVILASAPAATSATMFAEMYDCDATYVSRLVTISTLISIVTMPLLLLLV